MAHAYAHPRPSDPRTLAAKASRQAEPKATMPGFTPRALRRLVAAMID
ncbi:hypothetical protein PQU92_03595 [Asticcacaulis sp. BYS171W]|uniref:Uncharacterized protein n=1 Tax=Asticcacaulis aquaticus TaxID=2984212 RepID=A0ABT5HQW5_9CAUL|nr:hypothetical protein [Asticcacaulis aquaticus]MDC7682343.1 hypothetical protein [Asticcacaulis aquaticus]